MLKPATVLLLIQMYVCKRVQLSSGTIEGKILNISYSPLGNQSATVFLGIPFVEPPIGDLRYRKPRPPKSWEGVLVTNEYKSACMSNATKTYKNKFGGPISEDCLYLNVLTNEYCLENKNCSVMMIVHGGGYLTESASTFNPEILINNFVGQGRNIVVVTFNYRLGLFSFGQFNGDRGDKNFGLYDMIESVNWVRREIENFGGNKNRITLAGHSAGASMIVAFTSSPLTKGLVHQQIIMSAPMTNMSKKSNFKGMTVMAQMVGCLSEEIGFNKLSEEQVENTYSCLRKKSAQQILDAQLWLLQNSTYFLGAPPIDEHFLTDYPENLYASKSIYPINTLIGTTTLEVEESSYIIDPAFADKKVELLENLCDHIGYVLYEEPETFSKKCQKQYMNGNSSMNLSNEMEFYTPAIDFADSHTSGNTKVFLYSYDYRGAGPAYDRYLEVRSPHHSEDLIYVFGTHRGIFAPKDYIIEKIYSGMFADFVNFENPLPSGDQKWNQYTKENREHFLINFDKNFITPGMRDNYYTEAYEFWSTVGKKSFKEEWSPSLDTFTCALVISPLVSHMKQTTTAFDKTFEQTELLYKEEVNFLKREKLERTQELKMETKRRDKALRIQNRKNGLANKEITEGDEEDESSKLDILLIISAGTLFGGILYVTLPNVILQKRARDGYELLS
ncbi:Carboxylic ester hydrolase [Caenorhabditis elegans]|uniref:Carboxylic ester hydrolase n=1 Tax=Caenorhabditis elegans TaxID=6239 RepID=O01302_CAEEL|nr:Carboxylic ester hydrolase [Caenorhabditis elegans]CAB03272.2 Carboxylic ester hydrolase [Caenorhabditis elegans]|eukprot:NP_506506.1 Carboxylic ester hydrolase [Caenorhabditis elegans]